MKHSVLEYLPKTLSMKLSKHFYQKLVEEVRARPAMYNELNSSLFGPENHLLLFAVMGDQTRAAKRQSRTLGIIDVKPR